MSFVGIIIIIGLGVALLGGLIYAGMRENSGADPLQERLAEYGDREAPASLEELEMSLSFRDRVMVPVFKALANAVTKFTPEQQIESTRRQLELAGRAHTTDPGAFFGTRLMMTVLFGGLGFVVFGPLTHQPAVNALAFTTGFAGLGYFLPALQLKSQISRRQDRILKALPDA